MAGQQTIIIDSTVLNLRLLVPIGLVFTMSLPAKRSYREIRPRERGGEIARAGFAYQDHVAAYYMVKMLLEPTLLGVWCENHDDIVLVWDGNTGDEYEFVQVKSNELGQHWSVAELCKRETTKKDKRAVPSIGTSILEKSLANDYADEPCRFQMVTTCKVNKDLEVLALPLHSPDRSVDSGKLADLVVLVNGYVGDFRSENDNDPTFWLCRTLWRTWADAEHIKRENLALIELYCESVGEFPVSDQKETLYERVLAKVKGAAEAQYANGEEHKRLWKTAVAEWMNATLGDVLHPAAKGKGKTLRQKMVDAKIPPDEIANAVEQRLFYTKRRRDAQYLDLNLGEEAEVEARSELQRLLVQLDTGKAPPTGIEFLALCLERMEAVSVRVSDKGRVAPAYIEGFMYETADRCAFRFGNSAI